MGTEQLLAIIGPQLELRITNGKYGDTARHVTIHGDYLVGDPCYFCTREDDRAITEAAVRDLNIWQTHPKEWEFFTFRGLPAWLILCSDGNGALGCCVDSGMVAAIPMASIDCAIWNEAQVFYRLLI